MDLLSYTLQVAFFYMDFDLVSKSIDKAKKLFEEGGDWERKNRLKVYEGLYCMSTRNFKKAASLFLDSISTFTTYEIFPYETFIFYTVLTSIITLDTVSLMQKVVDAPEIFLTLLEVSAPLLVYSQFLVLLLTFPVHFCWEASLQDRQGSRSLGDKPSRCK
ncbi:26S proteasome non-ATPase regulatory subunit 6-like protein [Raphanus sativus]|nr:26S proteasome non-ATPase regulatory subunit 6-like protein [Raphanus sativus]